MLARPHALDEGQNDVDERAEKHAVIVMQSHQRQSVVGKPGKAFGYEGIGKGLIGAIERSRQAGFYRHMVGRGCQAFGHVEFHGRNEIAHVAGRDAVVCRHARGARSIERFHRHGALRKPSREMPRGKRAYLFEAEGVAQRHELAGRKHVGQDRALVVCDRLARVKVFRPRREPREGIPSIELCGSKARAHDVEHESFLFRIHASLLPYLSNTYAVPDQLPW